MAQFEGRYTPLRSPLSALRGQSREFSLGAVRPYPSPHTAPSALGPYVPRKQAHRRVSDEQATGRKTRGPWSW